MLSGIKFIPRHQICEEEGEENRNSTAEKRTKKSGKKEKHRRKRKNSRYSSGSDDDIGKIDKGSRRKKKWYSSDEHSLEDSSDNDSDKSSDQKNRKRSKKRSRSGKKHYSSEEYSSSASEEYEGNKGSGKGGNKKKKERGDKGAANDFSDDGGEDMEIRRKEMGLDWMLRPADRMNRTPTMNIDEEPQKQASEEMKSANPRELNPYLKDNGSGYPDEAEEKKTSSSQLPSSVVGDGGASWRLKALKRAQEQAAREGRQLEEVVEERWGSLGQLAVSAVSHTAAPARAHLHAIKNRRKGLGDETDATDKHEGDKVKSRGYLKGVSVRHPEMRAPKARDSLSWGKRKGDSVHPKDANLISAAASSLNKFADDGSFMVKVLSQQNNDHSGSVSSDTKQDGSFELKGASSNKSSEGTATVKEGLSANQLAAKALQLRMKGKHEEADKLMQEAEIIKAKQGDVENLSRPQKVQSTKSYVVKDISARRKEDDADRHLAQKILQNKQYSLSGRADDEYDFEDGPSRKSGKKGVGNNKKSTENNVVAKRFSTQQERCLFCFENPNRPRHLVVSIANFTYLMLPQWQSVVPGHCCILPMQHEAATRMVDNNVWDEIRNFKKCLIMMFAKQEKDLVFLETVMGLAKQRRHCMIECIPLPREISRQAPLYFKKAIDEAEDEWSQHNAKKLIDTSEKGLRNSIPKDFPYFHVEFGLNKGFVHVIDDEEQFKSSLGLNVIRGMLQLAEEDMYRRPRHETVDAQKSAVAKFAGDWEPFDWTKQLD